MAPRRLTLGEGEKDGKWRCKRTGETTINYTYKVIFVNVLRSKKGRNVFGVCEISLFWVLKLKLWKNYVKNTGQVDMRFNVQFQNFMVVYE